jgi:hypothetical protein
VCCGAQLSGPERSEKVDLQLKRSESFAFRQPTGIGHTHGGISNVTQDATMERSHGIRVLRCRFKLNDSLAGLYGGERKTDELSDRGKGEFATVDLLNNVCQGGHGACLLYLEVISARQASVCIAMAMMMT